MRTNSTLIGRNIRILAASKDLSLRDLARKSGVSEINVSFIVNGRTKNPGVLTIEKLARALGTDVAGVLKADLLNI